MSGGCSAALCYPLDVSAHPGGEGVFVEGTAGQAQHRLGRIFFAGSETIAIHFEKQGPDDEAGAFVPVDEGAVADDTGRVGGSELYRVRTVSIGVKLRRPGEGGFEQSFIAHIPRASVEGQKAIMKRPRVAFVDPDQRAHLASACSVLR